MAQPRLRFGHTAALFTNLFCKHNKRAQRIRSHLFFSQITASVHYIPRALFRHFIHPTASLFTTEQKNQEMARDVISLSSDEDDWNDGDYSPVSVGTV
jgi:hypothetical protein